MILIFVVMLSMFGDGLDRAFISLSMPGIGYQIIEGGNHTVPPGSEIHISARTTKRGAVYGRDITLILDKDGREYLFPAKRMEHGSVFFTWSLDSIPAFDKARLLLTNHSDSVISELALGAFSATVDSAMGLMDQRGLFPFEQTITLGEIQEVGGAVPVVFTLVNKSDREQLIRSIRATCGCTSIFTWNEGIEPNSYYHIYTFFDPRKYGGQSIEKKVALTFDHDRVLILSYTADVK